MIVLREAREGDIAVIRALAEETWPNTYNDIISEVQIEYMLEKMYNRGELLSQLQQGHSFIIASETAGDVGFAGYSLTCAEKQTYKLHKLYVLPKMQGKGCGKILLNEVVTKVALAGGKFLQLNVNRANDAYLFYQKAGFYIKETVDLNIGNGFFMNDYLMEKEL